jgi:hypothetical protein
VIETVAWAVPPGLKRETRPVRLIEELRARGLVAMDCRIYHHGKGLSTGESVSAGRLLPGWSLRYEVSSAAVLSPLYFPLLSGSRWVDAYDDWSLAPDVNRVYRSLARMSYRSLARQDSPGRIVTANSPYMAGRLRLDPRFIVPNGVERSLASLERRGDDSPRLVLLGHFFNGRTDFDLMRKIVFSGVFDELVVGGAGTSDAMMRLLHDARLHFGNRMHVRPWLESEDIAAISGPRSVGLLPHLVNDYTLSQDPMKIYQLLALGVRVIAPRMLWPSHLDREYAFLTDFGADLGRSLEDWVLKSAPPPEGWRQNFADENSWTSRARRLEELFEEWS